MTIKRTVLMARVSTKAQARETSLETQIERCRAYAERNGFDVLEELQDAISGTTPIQTVRQANDCTASLTHMLLMQ